MLPHSGLSGRHCSFVTSTFATFTLARSPFRPVSASQRLLLVTPLAGRTPLTPPPDAPLAAVIATSTAGRSTLWDSVDSETRAELEERFKPDPLARLSKKNRAAFEEMERMKAAGQLQGRKAAIPPRRRVRGAFGNSAAGGKAGAGGKVAEGGAAGDGASGAGAEGVEIEFVVEGDER